MFSPRSLYRYWSCSSRTMGDDNITDMLAARYGTVKCRHENTSSCAASAIIVKPIRPIKKYSIFSNNHLVHYFDIWRSLSQKINQLKGLNNNILYF